MWSEIWNCRSKVVSLVRWGSVWVKECEIILVWSWLRLSEVETAKESWICGFDGDI